MGKEERFLLYIAQNRLITVKRGNFYWWGNSDRSASFVKGAMVPTQECILIASAFMEINDLCLGLHIYMLLRPLLHCSNLILFASFAFLGKIDLF